MSGTFKTIDAANATCTAARCGTLLTRCDHPSVGQNLVMAGADRLVSQRSESGQGILAAKSGRGKYDWLYDVVCKAVMSFMSAGCSLAVRRDTPCLLGVQCTRVTSLLCVSRDSRDSASEPAPSPFPPSSLTHVHRCIGYRNPTCHSMSTSARLMYLSMYDSSVASPRST